MNYEGEGDGEGKKGLETEKGAKAREQGKGGNNLRTIMRF